MTLRQQILAADDPGLALIAEAVPEWGVTVHLRGWTALERERFERDFGDLETAGENIRARILVRCLRDAEGALIFSDADAAALGEKSAGIIARLFARVMELSALKAASLEDARKN